MSSHQIPLSRLQRKLCVTSNDIKDTDITLKSPSLVKSSKHPAIFTGSINVDTDPSVLRITRCTWYRGLKKDYTLALIGPFIWYWKRFSRNGIW
jgi:hypothetical protein